MHDGRVGGTTRSPAPPIRYEVRLPQHARTRHAPPLTITCSPAGAMCVCVLLTGAPLLLSELMIYPESKNETRSSTE